MALCVSLACTPHTISGARLSNQRGQINNYVSARNKILYMVENKNSFKYRADG